MPKSDVNVISMDRRIATLGKKTSDRKADASYRLEIGLYMVIFYNPTALPESMGQASGLVEEDRGFSGFNTTLLE